MQGFVCEFLFLSKIGILSLCIFLSVTLIVYTAFKNHGI